MMKLDYKSIGKEIKNYRKAKHLSQKNFAKVIGKSTTFLGKIERGESKPSLQTIVDIANGLEITVDDILANNIHKCAEQKVLNEYNYIFQNCSFDQKRLLTENTKFARHQLIEFTEFVKSNLLSDKE